MTVSFSSQRVAPKTIRLLSILALIGAPSLALLAAPPAPAQQATKSIWKVFKSEAGGFSLLMPGEPIESQSDGVTSYSVTRAKESVTYTVSFIDFPMNPNQEKNGLQEAFTGIRDGIIEEGGKISAEKTVAIKGFPGQELRVAMPDGALTRVRSYIVGKRLYLIMASTNNEKNLKRSLQGFLDSFRVKPVAPPAAPTPVALSAPSDEATPSDETPASDEATPSDEAAPTPAAPSIAPSSDEAEAAPAAAAKPSV